MSLVGGPAFAECDATSEKPDGFDCSSGLNGKHMDRKFGTWKTKGQGKCCSREFFSSDHSYIQSSFGIPAVGESITVRFRHLVQL